MKLILNLSCPDRPGIVQAVSTILLEEGGNILEAAQFEDVGTGLFFMRVKFEVMREQASKERVEQRFAPIAQKFSMEARFADADAPTPTVLMVSRIGHCLNDLLFRWKSGLLPLDICAVVSNHSTFEGLVSGYGIPFHVVPVTAATKPEAEARQLEIIDSVGAELVVLARYMQVMSQDMCRRLNGRAINIHHSFLPSFKGAKPYYQAHDRGVKLIGATAHYVTADLDEGPIIEQEVARADHAMDPAVLTSVGRDVECVALARAVKWHAERRILLNGHKTVVFR